MLTAQEAGDLFRVLEALKADGTGIVFISHKLNEVLEVADRVTVLRRGKRIDTVPTEGATEESLARLMVGREVLLRVDKPAARPKEPVLEVRDVHVRDDRDLPAVNGATLTVHAGEIVALAGVDGNGQSELVDAITGLRAVDTGAIIVEGKELTNAGARGMVRHGVSHIAEDRQRRGLVLNFTLAENLALREYNTPKLSRHGMLLLGRMRDRARDLIKEYDVRGGGPTSLATSLSGGNQQKMRDRARDRVQSARPRRRAADPRPGRWRDRVRPPPPRVRARRRPRDPARVARVRGGPLAGRSDRRHLRRRDRGRVPARRVRGGTRHRDDRRWASEGRRRVSNQDPVEPPAGQALAGEGGPEAAATTSAARLAAYLQGGGVIVPLLTAVLAFFVGGLVILITGHNPISTYKAIFNGTGLNWIFPWVSGDERTTAALNLQQTLITTTPLILTGLAVAFAFRCGLFNIGGQGQYLVGSYVAVWVGSSFAGMPRLLHVVLAMVLATLAGAVWAGIAGLLKAVAGAHEVISTIMLNWIAVWVGAYLFQLNGPLQNSDPSQQSVPVSSDVAASAKLPVFWGDPELQGLHIGIFIALAAAVVFWVLLNRSTTGYEVRAVGFNPEAARYGGISVSRNYILVMSVCGAFAGLAGSVDLLGWQFHIATNDILNSANVGLGFFGIAVALLGRNTASGTVVAALLFGALLTGTSQRNLDPTIFEPELAGNLTLIIQGLVVLIVSADVIVLTMLRRGRAIFRRGTPAAPAAPAPPAQEAEAA